MGHRGRGTGDSPDTCPQRSIPELLGLRPLSEGCHSQLRRGGERRECQLPAVITTDTPTSRPLPTSTLS